MNKTQILSQPSEEKSWLFKAFYFSIFFLLLSTGLIQIWMAREMRPDDSLSAENRIFFAMIFQLSLLASGLIPALLFQKGLPLKTKLKLENWKISYLPITIAILALLLPFLGLLSISVNSLLSRCGFSFDQPKIAELIKNAANWQLAVAMLIAVFIAPLSEELLFRRIIFGFLEEILGPVAACLAASALFATVHFNLYQIPTLFVLGVSFQLLYIKYRSIYPAIMLHALNNAVNVMMIILFFR